jgi:hypothetical protein
MELMNHVISLRRLGTPPLYDELDAVSLGTAGMLKMANSAEQSERL